VSASTGDPILAVYNSVIDTAMSDPLTHSPAPRMSRRRRSLVYALISGIIGAGAVIVAAQLGGVHWGFKPATWVLFGFISIAPFGPLFSLAREHDDNAPKGELPEWGNSDTSYEGAQAHDLGQSPPKAPE
jgi:hypothetical protein